MLLISAGAFGQSKGYLRYDTLVLQKVGGNSELVIMNGSRNTAGILTNMGGGRTQFVASRVSGDTLFVGRDTLTGIGGTISNLGSAYRLYSPGSKGVKTVAAGSGITIDSVTSNQLGFKLGIATNSGGNAFTEARELNMGAYGLAFRRNYPSATMDTRIFSYASLDTVTVNTFDIPPVDAGIFYRGLRYQVNRKEYTGGFQFSISHQPTDSTNVRTLGGDFGYATKSTLQITRPDDITGRRTVFNSTENAAPIDAMPAHLSWTIVNRPAASSTMPIRARGWYSGNTSYLIIQNTGDTLGNYVGFITNSLLNTNARVGKFYDFYGYGSGYAPPRIDSAWSFYAPYSTSRNYFAGPLALGGVNTGPTEQLELFGNFKHFNLPYSSSVSDSMVVWNASTKLYGMRGVPSGGGGGSTSLPSGEVGYGTGSGITSSPAFVYGTGQLAVGEVGTQGYYKIFGGTSGAVRLTTAAAAGTWDLTLPTDDGTNGQVLTTDGSGVTSWQTVSGGSPVLSSILAASAANTIDNTNYKQKFNWSTLGGDTAMVFRAHTTGASSNAQVLGASILTGANATSSQTTIAWAFQNAKTGTSATNIAADFTASGGTTNIAGRFSAESNNIQLTNAAKSQNTGIIERNSSGGLTVRGDIDGLWLRSGGSATSGIEINTLAASAPIILKTNNSERVRVTNAGLALYQPSTTTAPDSALYIEDGVVKATLVSGTYTPTASAASGITVSAVEPFVWSRTGSVVTVSGYVGTSGVTPGTPASFNLTLPISSNFTTAYECSGQVGSIVAGSDGYVISDATNDRATVNWVGGATAGTQGLRITFQYQVL